MQIAGRDRGGIASCDEPTKVLQLADRVSIYRRTPVI